MQKKISKSTLSSYVKNLTGNVRVEGGESSLTQGKTDS